MAATLERFARPDVPRSRRCSTGALPVDDIERVARRFFVAGKYPDRWLQDCARSSFSFPACEDFGCIGPRQLEARKGPPDGGKQESRTRSISSCTRWASTAGRSAPLKFADVLARAGSQPAQ